MGLPDEEGRWEIFEIHTRAMRNSSMLSPDVDLWELAANTTRFSGAEIAGVVRAASSYALERFVSERRNLYREKIDNQNRVENQSGPTQLETA